MNRTNIKLDWGTGTCPAPKEVEVEKDNKQTRSYYGGMGLSGWLTLLFIGLKLTGHISWSWWWVLSPVWITFGLVAVLFLVLLLAAGIVAALD
jgi:hypothetical protein